MGVQNVNTFYEVIRQLLNETMLVQTTLDEIRDCLLEGGKPGAVVPQLAYINMAIGRVEHPIEVRVSEVEGRLTAIKISKSGEAILAVVAKVMDGENYNVYYRDVTELFRNGL